MKQIRNKRTGEIRYVSDDEVENYVPMAKKGGWIAKAVNPAHKGYEVGREYDVDDDTLAGLRQAGYKFKLV